MPARTAYESISVAASGKPESLRPAGDDAVQLHQPQFGEDILGLRRACRRIILGYRCNEAFWRHRATQCAHDGDQTLTQTMTLG